MKKLYKDINFIILITIFLVTLEFMVGCVLFSTKIDTFTNLICPYSIKSYTYNIESNNKAEKFMTLSIIEELNDKLSLKLFNYDKKSPNIVRIFRFPISNKKINTIGETHCVHWCCGINDFSINLSEYYFNDRLSAKLLLWHELGHVVGLNHDDSKLDVMNSIKMDNSFYNNKIEETYLSKVKNRLGLK